MKKGHIIALLHLFLGFNVFCEEAPENIASSYVWKNVAIGGGGYVTGIVVHPRYKDIVYIRTDIGGAYRWNEDEKNWIPLTDWIGFNESNLYGVDGIAIDPNNKDIVYMAVGKYENSVPHDVLKSMDGGKSWVKTGLFQEKDSLRFWNRFGGNQDDRWIGEPIAVSPADGRLILAATRKNGLWISKDQARTWFLVKELPIGNLIRTVVFGKKKTGKVFPAYVSVMGVGIYYSSDGINDWKLLPNSPKRVQRMDTCADGSLIVSEHSGVYRYDGTSWSDISPDGKKWYGAVSVNPYNSNIIIVSQYDYKLNLPFWLSRDGGKTWEEIHKKSVLQGSVPWAPKNHFASATASLIFDPHYSNRVWMVDWYATWRTEDITADTVIWRNYEYGHEEIVSFCMLTPERGVNLISGMADIRGFRHENLDDFPKEVLHKDDNMKDITGLDFCESDPNYVVRTATHGTDKSRGIGAVSTDNGRSWTYFDHWYFGAVGRVVMSATDYQVILAAPWGGNVKRSNDFGKTWHDVEGLPSGIVSQVWEWHQPLASDRVLGNVFYVFHKGKVYRSDDAGKTFSLVSEVPSSGIYAVKGVPRRAKEVWISSDENGLYKSINGAESFEKIRVVDRAHLFAFGKNAPGSEYPAIFLYGTVAGEDGIFRSDDYGKSWKRINSDKYRLGNNPNCMAADRQIFGRVYIGTNGRGIFYGEQIK